MSQVQYLLDMFRRNGNVLTLGQILAEKGAGLGSNETGRISDARKALIKEGKTITRHKEPGMKPTETIYRIESLPGIPVNVVFDPTLGGQGLFMDIIQ